MLDLYVEFEKALDALEQHQINYALCGGLAVTFLAQPRFTEDIDILVSPDDCERCKSILQPLGLKFFSTPMRFDNEIVEVHKLTKIDPGDHDYIFLVNRSESAETKSRTNDSACLTNAAAWLEFTRGV